MDEVENQQQLIEAAVSATFRVWRSRLRVQQEESLVLTRQLANKSEELRQLQQTISRFDAVQQENEQLKRELQALRSQSPSATSQPRYDELEHDRDALLQDSALKQTTIDSLQSSLRYEKAKSKGWLRHSKSSPSPSVSGQGSNLHQPYEAGPVHHTSATLGGVKVLTNQALLQRLVSPLENAKAEANPSISSVHSPTEEQVNARFTDESAAEDVLPPQIHIHGPGHCQGFVLFPDIDATYSYVDSSSELPPTMSPQPRSSPGTRRSDESRSPYEYTEQPPIVALPSDSTAPPSQTRPKQESSQENQPQYPSFNSVEVVSARLVGRSRQALNITAPDASLVSTTTGNADEPILVKSEQSQSFPSAAETAPCMMFKLNESLGENCFSSPKRARDKGWGPPHGTMPRVHVAEDEAVGPDDDNVNFQPVESVPGGEGEQRPFPGSAESMPLKEIKNNERVLPRTNSSSGPPSKKRKTSGGRGASGISIIAEDGEDHNRSHKSSPPEAHKPASPARSNNSAHGRLGNLLKGPSPARPILAKPSPRTTNLMDGYLLNAAASTKTAKKCELDALRFSEDKNWEWYDSAETLLDSVGSKRPPQPRKKPANVSPRSHDIDVEARYEHQHAFTTLKHKLSNGPEDEEPFRLRPLHRLDLSHFKVNPIANDGVEYAYIDVVRSRKQRKCLPGCTRPECCGSKFRALSDTLPEVSAKDNRFLGSSTADDASSQQSDNDLLNDFLGPGSEEKVRTLTPIARVNLLLEAKMKIIADKYGKMHRHAHERPKSPAGFWTTEMPGTQEEIANRLDAKKREREEVERRYREACQEGGRWIFADE